MDDQRSNRAVYLQPAFLICVVVLTVAGAGMSVMTKALGVYLKKEPLPLKKPLSELDERKLAPYQVVARRTIDNEAILKSLGTRDYIQWVLEDPCEPVAGPARRVLLFLTYYELPDRVPHVPEECYVGSGFERLQSSRVVFQVDGIDPNGSVPGRFLLFQAPQGDLEQRVGPFPVLYLFRINHEYAGSRDEARLAMNRNIFRRYSYFSKIELAFNQAYVGPAMADAIAASERLLAVLLPLLEQEHWPAREQE